MFEIQMRRDDHNEDRRRWIIAGVPVYCVGFVVLGSGGWG